MRKFLTRLGSFVVILLILWMGNFVFNLSQLNRAPDLKNSTTMVIGDSRMMTGINPDLMEKTINTAQNSESYFLSYIKLKYLLKHNKSAKRIILGFSYPSLTAYLDGVFYDDMATEDILSRNYPIVSLSDFGQLKVDQQKYYQVWFREMFLFPHCNHHNFIGKFESFPSVIDQTNVDGILNRHYQKKDSTFVGISKVNKIYLDSIVRLTKEQNIELILVNLPFHQDYEKRVPEEIKVFYQEVKEELIRKNISILDYGDLVLSDEYYKDHNHLSAIGAEKLTKLIVSDLKKLNK